MKTTQAERDELRRLEQAATKGPWLAGRMDTESYDINGAGPYKNIYSGPHVEDFPVARGESENCRANAALIAAARNSLAGLLDDVETLRATVKEVIWQAGIAVASGDIAALESAVLKADAALAEPKPAK